MKLVMGLILVVFFACATSEKSRPVEPEVSNLNKETYSQAGESRNNAGQYEKKGTVIKESADEIYRPKKKKAFLQKSKRKGEANSVEGEYLVGVQEGCDEEQLKDTLKEYKGLELRKISDKIYAIKFEEDPGIKELQEQIKSLEKIRYIEPNYVYEAK